MNDAVAERHPEQAPSLWPVSVFCSYAHGDECFRAELDKHLALMRRNDEIAGWHDRNISAGTDWKLSIDRHLKAAEIILLLVSADFLASDYCYEIEMRRAMERHEAGEARVIPIILRDCDWSSTPFSKLQALPRDARPIKNWGDPDEAYHDIVAGIRDVARQIRSARPAGLRVGSLERRARPVLSVPAAAAAALAVLLFGGAAAYLGGSRFGWPGGGTEQQAGAGQADRGGVSTPATGTRGDSETVMVSGFVLDARGREVEGVNVTLVELQTVAPTRTSSNGRFMFNDVPGKKGDWVEIEVAKDGYRTKREKYLIGTAIEIILNTK
jgi:hypothetical protein